MIFTVILFLLLIQEGQLSVSKPALRNSVSRLTLFRRITRSRMFSHFSRKTRLRVAYMVTRATSVNCPVLSIMISK